MAEDTASPKETEQMVVTINVGTHEIAKVEKVNKAGEREQLSEEECVKLAGEDEVEEIEIALEAAFEAGIATALEEEDEDEEEEVLQGLLSVGFLRARRRPVVSRLRRQLIGQLVLRRLLRRQLLQYQLLDNEKTRIPKHS